MGGADIFSDHTLIINSSNEMISKLVAAKDDADKKELVEKLVLNVYDSALLAQDNLKGEKLVKFLERTTELTGMNL
jgi:HSP90 family molecular chaperone